MIWNSVNKTIKNCRSLVSFKNSLKNIFQKKIPCQAHQKKNKSFNSQESQCQKSC